ncbi:MAG: SRPBCC family protein [Litorilinea sp.]
MINIQEVLQIQTARASVWQRFADIGTWNEWNREVLDAWWVSGTPWTPGAIFVVEHFTLFKARKQTRYIVQMCVETRTAVYQSTASFPLSMTSSVQLTDSLGGCRLEATHHYAGPLAPLVWLLSGRQKSLLNQAMLALKARVEGPRR